LRSVRPVARQLALAALAAGVMPAVAAAQLPAQLLQGVPPPAPPIPEILPPTPPAVAPGLKLPPPPTPAVVPNVNLAVRQVYIEGATAFPESRLAPLIAGLVGPAVPLARIEAARIALLNLYRSRGYVLTTVSAAVDKQGVLRFTVIEGHIRDVKLEGNIGPAGTQVLRFLHHLTEQRPIDVATLERWLLLAQDVPGVSLQAVLRPNADEPGALTLVARVARQAVSGLFTADNRAFPLTGPQEFLEVLDFNSFTEFGERTEVSLYETAGGTQIFGQASEDAFVGASGLRVRVYGGSGDSTPSGFLRAIGYEGSTTVAGASASYPLIRSREQTLNITGYIDAIQDEIWTDTGPGGVRDRTSKDSFEVFRLGANYAVQDLLMGVNRPAINSATVRLSQGLGGSFGPPSRPGEQLDFTKVDMLLTRTQTLFSPWNNATVALEGLATGQITNKPLPTVEQFFLGGSQFTRGYWAGEVTGDQALAWTAELQLNTGINLTAFGQPISLGAQFYAFYDWGYAWQLTRSLPNVHISSEGIGLRLNITRFTEFDIEGDIRNNRLPFGVAPNVRPIKADALFWRVLARF
jgi:hemolysin activation/secretion protein